MPLSKVLPQKVFETFSQDELDDAKETVIVPSGQSVTLHVLTELCRNTDVLNHIHSKSLQMCKNKCCLLAIPWITDVYKLWSITADSHVNLPRWPCQAVNSHLEISESLCAALTFNPEVALLYPLSLIKANNSSYRKNIFRFNFFFFLNMLYPGGIDHWAKAAPLSPSAAVGLIDMALIALSKLDRSGFR